MRTVDLEVEGMSCAHCVQAVTGALQQLPGVVRAEVDLDAGKTRVEYDESRTGVQEMIDAVENQGYSAQPAS